MYLHYNVRKKKKNKIKQNKLGLSGKANYLKNSTYSGNFKSQYTL